MKLCDHIAGIYRNEIEHGNEPVFVCTPSYVGNGFVKIMGWFRYSKLDKVNEKVIATNDNIYIEDGFFGMSLVPKKELSDVSEINE